MRGKPMVLEAGMKHFDTRAVDIAILRMLSRCELRVVCGMGHRTFHESAGRCDLRMPERSLRPERFDCEVEKRAHFLIRMLAFAMDDMYG